MFSGVQASEDLDIDWGEDDEEEEDEDEDGGKGSFERGGSARRRRQSVSSMEMASTAAFGAKHARMLSKLLTHVQLPGKYCLFCFTI